MLFWSECIRPRCSNSILALFYFSACSLECLGCNLFLAYFSTQALFLFLIFSIKRWHTLMSCLLVIFVIFTFRLSLHFARSPSFWIQAFIKFSSSTINAFLPFYNNFIYIFSLQAFLKKILIIKFKNFIHFFNKSLHCNLCIRFFLFIFGIIFISFMTFLLTPFQNLRFFN